MSLTICVLLWARPGAEDGLVAYEDRVLGIAGEYGCQVRQRLRSDGSDTKPFEIQILEFPARGRLDEFMADERRQSLAGDRDKAISRTEVIEVQVVT
jgi:hypothetical protein